MNAVVVVLLGVPEREQVVTFLMHVYDVLFWMIFMIALCTIAWLLWHLIPKKEY